MIPLEQAGKFVQGALVDAAKRSAVNEVALSAGMAEGVESAAAGAAAGAAALSGALFVMFDAFMAGLGGNSAIRTAGDLLFGERGPGLIQKGLGALGLGAFRTRDKDPLDAALDAIAQERR
ncbi:MAG: hypothetical protein AABZ64_17430, partial [Nitrospinota bacterium]